MKRLLGLVFVFELLGTFTLLSGCSSEKAPTKKAEPLNQEAIAKNEQTVLASFEKEMVLIPAGKFKMGPPERTHDVTITKPFYMGKYEVTQKQWEVIMQNNLSVTKGEVLPVTNVSWFDCQEFVTKLNEKTLDRYRFPTEAEWEYACRAGTVTAYSFGDKITPQNANYDSSGIKNVAPVSSYSPNSFGLHDMHSNVWEWCNDWHAPLPVGEITDPTGPATGTYRILRGGSFLTDDFSARSFDRTHLRTPDLRFNGIGFRLAKTK